MPRTRQYQAPQAPNSQAYGQRGDQIQAQQAMPLPQTDSLPPAQAPAAPSPTDPDLMAMAQQFDPGITPLSAPTQRPDEPVTAGLSLGAGPGPDIFSSPARAQRSADMLDAIARSTGDEKMMQLAARIRSTGGMR